MNARTIGFLILGLLVFSVYTVSADTGTYVLQKQNAELVIKNNTDVIINYDVDFTVTGGNIPWVTMGLPNRNFDIISSGGAVKTIRPSNDGSWTGVRIDLDKTYLPGQTFNYKFSVVQKKFVVPYNGRASVQFTPVYWDNAVIKNMQIRFVIPPGIKEVKTSDSAAIFGNDSSVTWQFTEVPKGVRKTVGLTMPINNETFASLQSTGGSPPTPLTQVSSATQLGDQLLLWVVIGVVVVFGIGLFFSMFGSGRSSNDDYTPPELYLNSASSKKKTKRNLQLACINDKSTMEDVKDESAPDMKEPSGEKKVNVPAVLCLICGALFFDKGNIEKAFKHNLKESGFNKNKVVFTAAKEVPRTTCPRCDGDLKYRTQTKGATTAHIYYCHECGGIWLERGEYENVKKLFDLQKEELKKDGKSVRSVEDEHWFFYPYIYYPYVTGGHAHSSSGSSGGGSYSGGHYGGGGSSSCVASSCACVSCACVACACACACAGGGAAGCSPKDKFNQISLYLSDRSEEHGKTS